MTGALLLSIRARSASLLRAIDRSEIEGDLHIDLRAVGSLHLRTASFNVAERKWIASQSEPRLQMASMTLGKGLVARMLALPEAAAPGIAILHDEAGAPVVQLDAGALRVAHSRGVAHIGLSLSRDSGMVAGAVVPLDASDSPSAATDQAAKARVTGIGIDIQSTTVAGDVLDYPTGAVERLLSADEIRALEGLERSAAIVRLTTLLAAKEAAFKSLSPWLRRSWPRRSSGSYADLPSDFRDVEIVGLGGGPVTGVLHGGLADAMAEAGEVLLVSADDGSTAAAVALYVVRPTVDGAPGRSARARI